jgi:hypothetical protein
MQTYVGRKFIFYDTCSVHVYVAQKVTNVLPVPENMTMFTQRYWVVLNF